MTARERLRCTFAFERADRLPVIEWASWWGDTLERWRGEGLALPRDVNTLREEFGQDCYRQLWLGIRGPSCPQPAYHGAPLITDEAGYEALLPHLYPEPDLSPLRAWRDGHELGETVVWLTFDGAFWGPRTLLGIEGHLLAFYDHPHLMHRIIEDITHYNQRLLTLAQEILTPDFMTFGEDMSYNLGPMVGEALFDEFLAPMYHALCPQLKAMGTRCIVDSDGDITRCIPWFLRAGVEGFLPLERQAGVDIAQLRAEHPKALFIGAFDKMTMPLGEEAMREEFERLLPTMRQGGFVPSCDHQTPPGVSLSQYRAYMALCQEYAEKAMEP